MGMPDVEPPSRELLATQDDARMRRALRLAALGREAAPNPMVGCVIVSADGFKVSEGWHVRPGEPHAEVNALQMAGGQARGATVYVTLEPCSHFGRTPPCADALIAADVARVMVAMLDPDTRVAGRGVERLRAAGVQVEVGLGEAESRCLNVAYIKHRTTGLPYVTAKMAMTLDGRIATASGDSRWITGPITRTWVHRQLRARNQAVLVGLGTVLADDPSLTVRLPHQPMARNPVRVIVDTSLRTPLHSQVVAMAAADHKTIIAYSHPDTEREQALQNAGVTLARCAADSAGRVDLTDLMAKLGHEFGVVSVLVEGGAGLLGSLLGQRLVDRYYATIAPKFVGDQDAPGPVGGTGFASTMNEALAGEWLTARRSGADYVLGCILQ